ncbi:hypothetical protein GCM10027570_01650 [Streptomonospora sediminis]
MSASDPNKGFPSGDEGGGDRPEYQAEQSADPARAGADPAFSAEPAEPAEPADTARPPQDAPRDDADPAATTDEFAASGEEPASGTTPDDGATPWQYEAAGTAPDPAEQPQAGGWHAPGSHPGEPGHPGYQGPPNRAEQQSRPEQHGEQGQHEHAAQQAPYGPAHDRSAGAEPAAWWAAAAAAGHAGQPGQPGQPNQPGRPGAPFGHHGPGQYPGAHPSGAHPAGGWAPGGWAGGPGSGGYPPPPHGDGQPGPGMPSGDEPRKPPFLQRNKVLVVAAATALVTSLIVGPAAAVASTLLLGGGGGTSALSGDSEGSVSTGNVSNVADQALPSVVSIQAGQGGGSGAVISSDGQILTNAHVVEAAEGDTVTVTFNDGSEAEAQVLGSDPVSDIAVIQAEDKSGLTTAKLGDSDKVEVGADVVAIGSPLGLQGTVTSGVVSAVDRPVNTGASQQEEQPQQQPQNPFGLPEEQQPQQQEEEQLQTSTVINAIQTDAPINPGNSGGPLMNMSGEVIGVNTAIASTGGAMNSQSGSIGLGFSIPINQAKPIAQQLIEDGQADYAAIEATITGQRNTEGATVVETNDGGAAAKAGLERGDRITHVDGKAVDGPNALIAAIRSHQPGDTITLGYIRDGNEEETEVTLSAQSSDSLNG